MAIAGGSIAAVVVYKHSWHMVWHDEFSGAAVDTDRWNVRNNTFGTNEASLLLARNVAVDKGQLTITARREQATGGGQTRPFTSGYLDTIGKHSWRYGKFAIRAKLPTAQGLWPAFWLRADTSLGEIDIMEAVGGLPGFTAQSAHQSTMGGQGKAAHEDHLPAGQSTADWHVYSVWLEPDTITWYIDGRQVFRVSAEQQPWLRTVFDHPMNIRLNLQVDGTMPAYYRRPVTPATVFPAEYVVDWVRVYQFG